MGFEVYDPEEESVSNLANAWSATVIQFAKYGDPNGAGLPQWPRYRAEQRRTMVLDQAPRIEANWEQEELALWSSVGLSP